MEISKAGVKNKNVIHPTKFSTFLNRFRSMWSIYKQNKLGLIGLSIILMFLVIALAAPLIAPYEPTHRGTLTDIYNPPSSKHWLGTDDVGQDVFSQVIFGTQVSLLVGIVATFISSLIGTLIGLFAGYSRGILGELLMRFTDFFFVIPWLPLAILLVALIGPNIWVIILVIGLIGWAGTARLVRSEVLSIRERLFIERAKAVGCSTPRILFVHIVPNVMPIVMANTILTIALSILSEATLSFLGLGDANKTSWGTMLRFAYERSATSLGAYWYYLPPGIAIILLVLGFTFIGNALDEILNPRLRRR
jgi:peptide/nickel transport system permease protein